MGWQRGEAGAQRPFLLFCLLEGEQLWDSAGSSAALCSPPSPLCPVRVSQCLSPRVSWCEGRQAGEGRGWSALHRDAGAQPRLKPALAAHICLLLSLHTRGQSSCPQCQGDPATGRSRSLGSGLRGRLQLHPPRQRRGVFRQTEEQSAPPSPSIRPCPRLCPSSSSPVLHSQQLRCCQRGRCSSGALHLGVGCCRLDAQPAR